MLRDTPVIPEPIELIAMIRRMIGEADGLHLSCRRDEALLDTQRKHLRRLKRCTDIPDILPEQHILLHRQCA